MISFVRVLTPTLIAVLLSLTNNSNVFAQTHTATEKKSDAKNHTQQQATTKKQPPKHSTRPIKKSTTTTVSLFVARPEWPAIETFINDLVSRRGFDKETLLTLFKQVHYSEKSANLIKAAAPSANKTKDWQVYRAQFLEPSRIQAGVRFMKEYGSELRRAETKYGVPAEIITAILGVETRYGQYTGNFNVLDALTTLGFDYPKETTNREARQAFFRKELENTLVLARASHLDPMNMSGSFAGAIGLPQFMPGSILAYGVDFDGDEKIDLEHSVADAIGSVANYLKEHGWTENDPIVFPATIPDDPDKTQWQRFLNQGLKAKFSLAEIQKTGITSTRTLPDDIQYSLVDLENGPRPTEYWLATDNFYAITNYNRSYFYAMVIVDVSQAIVNAKNLASQL